MTAPLTPEQIQSLCDERGPRRALEAARQAVAAEGAAISSRAVLAEMALRCGAIDEALAAAREVVAAIPGNALAHFRLGEILQYAEDAGADSHFHEAARLRPQRFVVPHRVTAEHFDEIAGEVVAALPPVFADVLVQRGTNVVCRPLPSLDLIAADSLDPHALGYHFSNPYGISTGWGSDGPPDAIEIYQLSIENWCDSEPVLRREIRRTVLHEIGHAFGMDHDLLHQDGY